MVSDNSCSRCLTVLTEKSVQGLCETCRTVTTGQDRRPRINALDDATIHLNDTASYRHEIESSTNLHDLAFDATAEHVPQDLVQAQITRPGQTYLRFEERYEVMNQIGTGGMGLLWKAKDLVTRRFVAIKYIKSLFNTETEMTRFLAEARALAQLKHDNIIAIYDFSSDLHRPYMCLEYVDGESLAQHIVKKTPMGAKRIAAIGESMARAVHAANLAGVIHRDLKPSNVMLSKDGIVKVVDFGLAKRLNADDLKTLTGQIVGGTPGFMAPEQLDPDIIPTARIDVWGLGATLYALLTGRPPFPTGTANAAKVQTEDLIPPRKYQGTIPKDLEAIVQKCLNKKPEDRYASVAEVGEELARFQRDEPTVVRPYTFTQKLKFRIQKVPMSTRLVLVAVAVASVSFGVAAMLPRQSAEQKDVLELQAGREVTILGESHPQHRTFRSFINANPLCQSELPHTGSCLLAHLDTMCELCSDPGIDNYRIEAELQMRSDTGKNESAEPSELACLGLYVGHKMTIYTDGEVGHTFLTVQWRDYDRIANWEKKAPKLTQFKVCGNFYNTRRQYTAGSEVKPAFRILPAVELAAPWRSIAVEVRPQSLKVWWQDLDPDRAVLNFQRHELDALMRDVTQVQEFGPLGEDQSVPVWTPRGGLGLYSNRASLGARNFKIIPLK